MWTGTRQSGDVIPWDPRNPNQTESPRWECGAWGAVPSPIGVLGDLRASDARWTENSNAGCNEVKRLYCFEQ